jgi:hypothetical protein
MRNIGYPTAAKCSGGSARTGSGANRGRLREPPAYKRDRNVELSTRIEYEHVVSRMKKVFGEKFGERLNLLPCICSPSRRPGDDGVG